MNKLTRNLSVFFLAGTIVLSAEAQTKGRPAAKKPLPSKKGITKTTTQLKNSGPVAEPWKVLNTKERLVEITTDYGVMIAKLYDSTPLHRDNFVKLVQQKFYDSLLFHRVIEGFMIQGGDPTSKNATPGVPLGGGSAPGERIPAEIKPYLFHKKGALAAARDNNPGKASSNCQFYIVHGKPMPEQEIAGNLERVKGTNPNFSYTQKQKEIYAKLGGTPFLDQAYTVFGEVISGLDVVDKIARAPKAPGDRPTQDIRMSIRLLN
jgi:cyclophilin family peptidyl-prolyl cis-trans isomerase